MSQTLSELGHIGILMGGCSSEKDISLKSGKAIYAALLEIGCKVSAVVVESQQEKDVVKLFEKARMDLAFIALHGQFGEDGGVQAILEKMGIPYTGSGVAASKRAIDKITTQTLLREHNVPVADFVIFTKKDKNPSAKGLERIKKFPVVVKPAREGSSIGITIVQQKKDLAKAMAAAFQYGPRILIENYVKGREMTVGILGEDALPIVEIKPKAKFFDFEAKYQSHTTQYLVPAELSENITQGIQMAALNAHKAIGCSDFSRVDFMLDEKNDFFVLEINTIPGFTATSLLPKAAAAAGYTFPALCLKIIQLAYAKKARVPSL